MIGSPLAAGLLSLDGLLGLKGWQWLFVVEGLPTVVLGMYIHRILVDGPAKATFLTAEERETVIHRKAQSLQVSPSYPNLAYVLSYSLITASMQDSPGNDICAECLKTGQATWINGNGSLTLQGMAITQ